MNLSDYQVEARTTAIYPTSYAVIYPVLGLNGEAGEAAELVKKALRDDGGAFTDERKELLRKELGDSLWYLANIASDMGWNLDRIAEENLDKLRDRKERGVLQGSGDTR